MDNICDHFNSLVGWLDWWNWRRLDPSLAGIGGHSIGIQSFGRAQTSAVDGPTGL